jgi:hypothetical protein
MSDKEIVCPTCGTCPTCGARHVQQQIPANPKWPKYLWLDHYPKYYDWDSAAIEMYRSMCGTSAKEN